MSQFSSHREPQRNGTNGKSPQRSADASTGDASVRDPWGSDDDLRQEMERLAAEQRQILAGVGREPQAMGTVAEHTEELELLHAENADLLRRVEELEQALLERPASEEDWTERQKEYEALLEEKSEVIRGLHQKIQELRENAAAPAAPRGSGQGAPRQQEELAVLKRQLEEQRAQLEQDEQALEQQMRQMEISMSRERAELARQRSELQRLHNDLKREMELAARDAGLRDRLVPLQRRQQEVNVRRGSMPSIELPPEDETTGLSPSASTPAKRPSSGLLGRLFGSKDA